MTKEQKFFNALKDLFVGAQVKGKSGYIKLMQARSHYYEEIVFPKLLEDIDRLLAPFPEYRQELLEQLYDFFSRYISPTGSICFYNPTQHDIALLFWKTHMLYYVKTDRLYNDLEVKLDGIKFFFDVSKLEHKKANEKQEFTYEFQEKIDDSTLIFEVTSRKTTSKNSLDDILCQLQEKGLEVEKKLIKRAIKMFEHQNEIDYFINKDAQYFLEEQFRLWFLQHLFSSSRDWTENGIKKLQVLKEIAFEIISSISRFENKLIQIWNKPKFVLNLSYVITLDRITARDMHLFHRLTNHPGIGPQVEEWQELGLVGDNFQVIDIINKKSHHHLPIDTKYFRDLEGEILSLFRLDEELDGWLIKSENYQALNTILPKFQDRVQVIYIDPPFNHEQDAGYHYSVKYNDATWITLLENRLQLAREILKKTGCIFVRCDYNGNMYVRLLMDQVFGPENFKNEIIVRRSGIQKAAKNKFLVATDSLFFYSKTEEGKPENIYEHRETNWLPFVHYPGPRKTKQNRIVFNYVLEPPPGRHWGLKQELIDKWAAKRWVRFRCRGCGYEHYDGEWKGCPKCGSQEFIPELKNPPKKIDSNWTNIQSYTQDPAFPTRNAEELLKRIIEATSTAGEIVMDFFLGSGTTTATAHKMGRKWIGVEMDDRFYTYLLPRMKKVLSGEQSGISKEVNWQGGGFFKYCELEQYENTLQSFYSSRV